MACSDEEFLHNNHIEDVTWLCSLSESELDFLISLKMLMQRRAKVIGHEHLAEKFDLKMLRALGMILMDYLKEKVKHLEGFPGMAGSASHFDASNLLKLNLEDVMTVEDIKACIGTILNDQQWLGYSILKMSALLPHDEVAPNQKKQRRGT